MIRAHHKVQLVGKQLGILKLFVVPGLQRNRQINLVFMQQIDEFGRIARLNHDVAVRKLILKVRQDLRKNMLAGRRAGSDTNLAPPPLIEVRQFFAGLIHRSKNLLRMMKKMFTCRGQDHLFAHSVQKSTPYILLQRPE